MTSGFTSVQFPALGSTAVVAVTDAAAIGRARAAVQKTVAAFDAACSRFREDSELTALNAAAGSAVQVTPLLMQAVKAALRAARLTDGDVDPTVGAALVALGYDRDFGSLASRPPIRVLSVPGWQTILIDEQAMTIRTARGVRLDLGATAKALAADRAADNARELAGCGVLVSLGGDIAVAGAPPARGWRVRVTDDHAAGVHAPGQWITLRSGGLATSSTTVRRWHAGNEVAHHLVDPATARPVAGPWRTASVTARSCLDANIASTAAIVRGEQALGWLASRGLPGRLVGVDGIARHVGGWPIEGDDLAPAAASREALS
jgi:thiamine biosynthesis lipoprotein